MITHTIESYWIPSQKKTKSKLQILKNQIVKFWNGHYTRHTFLSCLIRCANMKWIRWVLLKIQSGQDCVHRWTDGQGDTSITPFQLRWSEGYNKTRKVLLKTDTVFTKSCLFSLRDHLSWEITKFSGRFKQVVGCNKQIISANTCCCPTDKMNMWISLLPPYNNSYHFAGFTRVWANQ